VVLFHFNAALLESGLFQKNQKSGFPIKSGMTRLKGTVIPHLMRNPGFEGGLKFLKAFWLMLRNI